MTFTVADEALRVDLWSLRVYRDQLVAERAPAKDWERYRAWRGDVMARAEAALVVADAA